MVRIATWNVNSIKARLPNVLAWLKETQPDIVLLQETKTIDDTFPAMEIEDLGYNIAIHGQKTYNGVAILSKYPIDDVIKGLPGDDSDEQARYIEAVISVPDNNGEQGHKIIRTASIYVPNGQSPDSDKFQYKMRFFERLWQHAQELLKYDEKLILGGDYNVAPEDIDVYAPEAMRNALCFHPDEQKWFRTLLYSGLTDIYRAMNSDKQAFSWWDYRGGSWQQNKGMRIDHLLLSPQAADSVNSVGIDDATRGETKASDHAPVWCEIS